MKLSDTFILPEEQETSGRSTLLSSLAAPGAPALECTALVLNINYGKNRELMEKCRKLGEYAQFVACMRRHMKGKTTEKEKLEAVNAAVDECIRKGILKDILIKQHESPRVTPCLWHSRAPVPYSQIVPLTFVRVTVLLIRVSVSYAEPIKQVNLPSALHGDRAFI